MIAFRPVTGDDYRMIEDWLARPHVARWWGNDPAAGLARIAAHVGSPTVAPFVVLLGGRAVGYIQSYDIHGEAGHPYQDQPEGAFGIDQFIGEPDLVGRGLGPRIIEAFVATLFARGVTRVVIDPDPDNRPAVRAYEKAGFRALDRRTTIYGPALMMARDATEQTRPS